MTPKKEDCERCLAHTGIGRQLKTLFTLVMGMIAVIVVSAGLGWNAIAATSKTQRDLDVHTASQNQKIINIEKATIRNEAALRRIEELLRER